MLCSVYVRNIGRDTTHVQVATKFTQNDIWDRTGWDRTSLEYHLPSSASPPLLGGFRVPEASMSVLGGLRDPEEEPTIIAGFFTIFIPIF
jgi:hypothetical protein